MTKFAFFAAVFFQVVLSQAGEPTCVEKVPAQPDAKQVSAYQIVVSEDMQLAPTKASNYYVELVSERGGPRCYIFSAIAPLPAGTYTALGAYKYVNGCTGKLKSRFTQFKSDATNKKTFQVECMTAALDAEQDPESGVSQESNRIAPNASELRTYMRDIGESRIKVQGR